MHRQEDIYFVYVNLCFNTTDDYYDARIYWRKNGSTTIQLGQTEYSGGSGTNA